MSKVNHHPDSAMLVDFSAGNLNTAPSICVSAHLHFCAKCRSELLRLDQVGSKLMSEAEPIEVGDLLLDSVMAKIDQLPESAEDIVPSTSEMSDVHYPLLVNKLITASESTPTWRRMSASVDVAQFTTGQKEYEVALHKICSGGKTPRHDHGGREFTVVLKGSFSDEQAVYNEGDFLQREAGDVHQPMGAQNGECICLSALAAPIKLSNPFGFLMKPWLRINPM
ncbi:MAG: ChrR family anti-sigma-E factor [Porticoccaceae bacterium]|nr:ChrR family anti-sigma-E factor [Porticoccaceae bacterium]|tara:strand:+ start:15276 stop:15947 length:672 start_codon:yes stop_codon:yes gene_type:complete